MFRGSLRWGSLVTVVAAVFVMACDDLIDRADARYVVRFVGLGESEPPAEASQSSAAEPPRDGGSCSSIGASCQIFEPGGPERWGCFTVGTDPELACEHPAGATVAHCNCSGTFAEPRPASEGIEWFDMPATSAIPAESEIVELWRHRCNGRCVPRHNAAPAHPDGG